MAYQVSWLVPQRVIFVRVTATLTRDDIVAMNQDYFHLLDEGVAPVHMLVDANQLDKLDIKVKDIPSLLMQDDARFGWNFIVTPNRFIGFLSNLAAHLTGSKYKTMDKLDEALQVLVRLDSSLPQDLQPYLQSQN
ncbi:MAG: hypothetical protein L0154_09720 [Chloroflexi bacterium]|nr:hypothetical protein [Chloroflexota bacterium]